jgi:hypothetical protein
MNRVLVATLGAVVVTSCAGGHAVDRRTQIRMTNAAAHRSPDAPVVELVLDGDSQWPADEGHRCAPVLRKLPPTVVKAGEFEVLTAPDATPEAMEGLLTSFACEHGWAAITLGAPEALPDGRVRRPATFGKLMPGLRVAFASPEFRAWPREPGCAVEVLRTPRAAQAPVELVTLFLTTDDDPASAQRLLQAHACALGADAIVISQEAYDLPKYAPDGFLLADTTVMVAPAFLVRMPTTRVTATAMVNPKDKPGSTTAPPQL